MPASLRSSSRTDIRSPARAARRRMRWAIWRARTQVKTWTLCCARSSGASVRTRRRAGLSSAGRRLGFGLGPVPGHDRGHGPVVVIGDQDVLAEDLFFQGCPGVRVDAPGQAQVFSWTPCRRCCCATQGLAVMASISVVPCSCPASVISLACLYPGSGGGCVSAVGPAGAVYRSAGAEPPLVGGLHVFSAADRCLGYLAFLFGFVRPACFLPCPVAHPLRRNSCPIDPLDVPISSLVNEDIRKLVHNSYRGFQYS